MPKHEDSRRGLPPNLQQWQSEADKYRVWIKQSSQSINTIECLPFSFSFSFFSFIFRDFPELVWQPSLAGICSSSEREGGGERAGRQSQSENTNSIKLFKNNFYLLPTRFICCRCLCRCGLSTLPRPLTTPPPSTYVYI